MGRRRMCFRLNPRRVWVRSLRARFFYLLGIFRRWRTASYSRALEALKEGLAGSGSSSSASRKEGFGGAQCRLRSCGYSSPFYSEAIADCLEFIKRLLCFCGRLQVSHPDVDKQSSVCICLFLLLLLLLLLFSFCFPLFPKVTMSISRLCFLRKLCFFPLNSDEKL
ncbi:hypothetical protein NMG60_11007697 [Bertholletia excelsa]